MYKNPRELEAKLMLMIGSMKAGNTSRELESDVRRILDEMLKTNYVHCTQATQTVVSKNSGIATQHCKALQTPF